MKLIQIVRFSVLVSQAGKSRLIVCLVRLYWTTLYLDASGGGEGQEVWVERSFLGSHISKPEGHVSW